MPGVSTRHGAFTHHQSAWMHVSSGASEKVQSPSPAVTARERGNRRGSAWAWPRLGRERLHARPNARGNSQPQRTDQLSVVLLPGSWLLRDSSSAAARNTWPTSSHLRHRHASRHLAMPLITRTRIHEPFSDQHDNAVHPGAVRPTWQVEIISVLFEKLTSQSLEPAPPSCIKPVCVGRLPSPCSGCGTVMQRS